MASISALANQEQTPALKNSANYASILLRTPSAATIFCEKKCESSNKRASLSMGVSLVFMSPAQYALLEDDERVIDPAILPNNVMKSTEVLRMCLAHLPATPQS
eukprot:4455097-Pyramimonas_sp.AAC.1